MRLVMSLVSIVACAAAIGVAYYFLIRPRLLMLCGGYIEQADNHAARVWAWLMQRKLEALAGIAAAAPYVPDVINELAGIDWSPLGSAGTMVAHVIAVVAIIAKVFLIRRAVRC